MPYIRVLYWLLRSISWKKVVFIFDDSSCSQYRVEHILKVLTSYENVHGKPFTKLFLVVSNGNNIQQLYDSLFTLKMANVGLLIMLTTDYYFDMVFKASHRFDLVSSKYLWIIPDFDRFRSYTVFPTKLMTFRNSEMVFKDTSLYQPYIFTKLVNVYFDNILM